MSADTLTQSPEPAWCATVPGFPRVWVSFSPWREQYELEYSGTANELIAAAVVTEAMLAMAPRKGPRPKRQDADGDRFVLTRYWRSTDEEGEACAPYRWYRIGFLKPLPTLRRLPGAEEAIAARARYDAWERQHRPWLHERERAAQPPKPRPELRVVVDNTRPVQP